MNNRDKICIDNRFTLAPALIFALTALFSSICIIFNIKYIAVSLILAVAAVVFIGIKYDRKVLVSCIATIVLALLCIVVAGHVYDVSYDGMYFHKEAVAGLARGWNPFRTSFWYFDFFGRMQNLALWLDNYPKGAWSFYACIYSLCGKIEYAKGANIIFVLMLFFAACDTLSSVFSKKGGRLFLLAAVFTANPVIASQFFTYMNDLPGAAFVMICAFIGMKIYAGKANNIDYICLAAVFASSFAVKFTAPVFCGFTLAAFGAATAIKNKGKKLLKPCVIVISAAAIGVFIMGADPYVKHIAEGKNPVYPVMGEDSYDIMNTNAPEGLEDMPAAKSLLISLFSKASPTPGEKPVLKIPFTVDFENEIWGVSAPDVRTSGFGLFFSGILLLSLVLGIIALVRARGAMPLVPALVIFTLLALFFPESWWARYNPYVYYIPCLLLLAFSCADKTKIVSIAMSLMILFNSAISGGLVMINFYRQTKLVKYRISELQETGKHIYFQVNDFPCHEIWFNEHDLDFELVEDFEGEECFEFYQTTKYRLKEEN